MKDVDSGQMKIKLYTERGTDILKGDALCTYIKVLKVFIIIILLNTNTMIEMLIINIFFNELNNFL